MIIKTWVIHKDRYKSNKVIGNPSLLCLLLISANLWIIQLSPVIDLYIIHADLLKQLNVQSEYQHNNDGISMIVAWD